MWNVSRLSLRLKYLVIIFSIYSSLPYLFHLSFYLPSMPVHAISCFFPSLPLGRGFIEKQNDATHSLYPRLLWLISSPHPFSWPPSNNPPQPRACQLFAWAVNQNFLVRIHFSCLGTITKEFFFLSTDLVPCANVEHRPCA